MNNENIFEKLRTDKIETLFRIITKHFDIVNIRGWKNGYTVTVGISRPTNAPHFKRTRADRKRQEECDNANSLLQIMGDGTGLFKDIEHLLEAIFTVSQMGSKEIKSKLLKKKGE
jgi:hypothetical protein